jgi:hypothetical protein
MPLEPVRLLLLNVSYKIYEKLFNDISVSDVFKQGQVAGCASGSLVYNKLMTLISYVLNSTHITPCLRQNIF